MRFVRETAGTESECAGVCAHKTLNTGLCRDYYWRHHFKFSLLVPTGERGPLVAASFLLARCIPTITLVGLSSG
jgi:hypothetical protein